MQRALVIKLVVSLLMVVAGYWCDMDAPLLFNQTCTHRPLKGVSGDQQNSMKTTVVR
jgi:hypothetical protein